MGRGGRVLRVPVLGVHADIPTRAFRLMACLLCTGPVLLVVALVLVATIGTRDALVDQYNIGVKSWTSKPSPAKLFQESGPWTVETRDAETGPVKTVPVAPYDGMNAPPVASESDVQVYTEHARFLSIDLTFSERPWPTDPPQVFAPITLTTNNSGVPHSVMSDIAKIAYVEVRKYRCELNTGHGPSATTANCPEQCTADSGYWDRDEQVCKLYWVLSEVCWVVDAILPQRKSPVYDGCAYDSSTGSLNTYVYTQSPQGPSIKFSAVSFSLRSGADPWILAASLTKGTFDFGAAKSSQFATGIAAGIIGFLFTVGPCVLLRTFITRKGPRRRRSGRRDRDKGRSPNPWRGYPTPQRTHDPAGASILESGSEDSDVDARHAPPITYGTSREAPM